MDMQQYVKLLQEDLLRRQKLPTVLVKLEAGQEIHGHKVEESGYYALTIEKLEPMNCSEG